MAKKVTLDHVAAKTNLSKYAVSRAIAGKPGISIQTRARVLEACRDLGYVKASTKEGDKYVLLFIPKSDVEDATFWMRVLQGVESGATQKGFALHVKIIRSYEDATITGEIEKAAGVIYAGYKSIECMRRYKNLPCPSLLMTYPPENLFEMDTIYFADEEAGFALCEKLITWNHKKIAFWGPIERPSSRNRFEGVKSAMQKNGLELQYVWSGEEYEDVANMEAELNRLKDEDKLPTAIMCSNDGLAQTLIFVLGNMHVYAPEDISVTGFNSDLDETLPIPLTSIGHSKKEYGKLAFGYLFERINNPNMAARRIVVVPKLLLRSTAGPQNKEPATQSG